LSDKAWSVIRQHGGPRFYWDFRKAQDSIEKDEMTFTAPVSLIAGLHVALHMIHAEGLGRVLARHRRLANALRAGCAAIGLRSFPNSPLLSNTVSVFHTPDGLDGGTIVRRLYEKHRTVIAGARNKLSGKVIRIATMGYVSEDDILTDLAELEDVLGELGMPVQRGAGIAAAATTLAQH
jgi:aspartate aminotransferase-like enzyme